MIQKEISLYLDTLGRAEQVLVSQFDTMWQFVFKLYRNGQLWTIPSGATAVLNGLKPDGNVFAFSGTISENTVIVNCDVQMTACAGQVACELSIMSEGKVLNSRNFWLLVEAAPKAPGDISSETTLPAYGELIEQLAEGGAVALPNTIKQALLTCFEHVWWTDEHGREYYNALEQALYSYAWLVSNNLTNCTTSNEAELTDKGLAYSATITANAGYKMAGATVSITMGGEDITSAVYSNGTIYIPAVTGNLSISVSAVVMSATSVSATFTQGNNTIFSNAELDDLREYLSVSAVLEDGSTISDVTDYTLSGVLADGTIPITVSFRGAITTFNAAITGFVIPSGYTRYDYITKKTKTSQSNIPRASFIWLNSQTDMNVLSLETTIQFDTSSTFDQAGIMGARSSASGNDSFSVYARQGTGGTQYIQGIARGGAVCNSADDDFITKPMKFKIINPATSPFYVQLGDTEPVSKDWTTSSVLPYGMSLFNNIPDGYTGNLAINRCALIGDIILRKNDGECVGYYSPCVYNGKIGMYDQITQTFYTAATAAVVTVSNSGCLYAVGNWT